MCIAADTLTLLLAILHVYILILEMFLWTKQAGRKAFGMSAERAELTRVMAGNQGLYNGFLAAGLIWALLHPNPIVAVELKLFFTGCVLVAGLYGGLTVGRKILYIQALPAAIGLLLTGLCWLKI
ncbi:DUF1304 domain-containing protein [Rhizobium helianthi]|uniref:DUF1304 domain-containing protein n=1 Tax=Rhizobium helianthi TaxID=1132695 RepID=A0ABW4M2H4_9HYPH